MLRKLDDSLVESDGGTSGGHDSAATRAGSTRDEAEGDTNPAILVLVILILVLVLVIPVLVPAASASQDVQALRIRIECVTVASPTATSSSWLEACYVGSAFV
ncbi:hypothetical protein V8D89_003252 [Ganoderma adspersum]